MNTRCNQIKTKWLLIALLPMLLIMASSANASDEEDGWVDLFDGETFNGWRLRGGEADIYIEDGVIVREWLVRDNMTLATQLGANPVAAARMMAERRSTELGDWIASEIERVRAVTVPETNSSANTPREDPEGFAWHLLNSCWSGDWETFENTHAPYSVLHRSPMRHYSGRDQVFGYYQNLRRVLGHVHFSVDHIATQPFGDDGVDIAVRWTAAGLHEGEVEGIGPTGKPMFIMGVTHWRCIAGRIAIEMTVFDDLAVLSQTLVD